MKMKMSLCPYFGFMITHYRVLLGSVSSYVVSHSHSSVMVVKGNLPVSPRKYLYCYDG
jgi:hypothetical protein